MNNRVAVLDRAQSLGEEIANSVSHGVGLAAALIAAPFLLVAVARHGSGAVIVGAGIFVGTMVLLYLTSTLYHALAENRAKHVFQVLDHSAIFLLIAGTYTPFTLGVLRGPWGWALFGLVWGLAVVGMVLKAVGGVRYPVLSTFLYLGMGWLALIAIRPLWLYLPLAGLLWLVAGGAAYTVGVAFFALDERVRYAHFVWHLFVMAGTACHFVAVYRYAA
ncbi:MAG TPA: hemolysin III family protein [Acidiferrobacterales bacterium]|nr:hemolysin III family protein [Acidiferrobacterales bacterium]